LAWETIQVHESSDDDHAVLKAVGQEVVHGGSKTIFAAVVPPEDMSDGGILRNRLSRGGAFRCFGSACHNCEMRLIGKEYRFTRFREFNTIKTNRVCVGVLSLAGAFIRLQPEKNSLSF